MCVPRIVRGFCRPRVGLGVLLRVSLGAALAFGMVLTSFGAHAFAQTQTDGAAPSTKETAAVLDGFSNAVEAMVQRVSPSVVQILVTRYDTQPATERTNVAHGWEQSTGSGVIVASDGYIITNAHVVAKAQQIKVRLVPVAAQTVASILSQPFATAVDANLVGTFAEADLALLKIPAEGLNPLPIADFGKLRQGQMAFAFGSPGGLQNSVTMGVVSSVARQLDPDDPMLYIQTDAPINPGNSGGPLVSTAGEMVGLNTFITTQSGGSEGIGFAIPGVLVRWVYEQLRKYGHVHRPAVGAGLQTITPTLAAALKLPRDSGVIVSDLMPDSPATQAGMKLNDIVISVNDHPMDNVAAWMGVSFQYVPGSAMKVQVIRGNRTLTLNVTPAEIEEPSDHLADLGDLSQRLIPSLGIMAVTLDKRMESSIGPVRLSSGAVVIARTANPRGRDIGLQPGDLIHEVNGRNVFSVEDLRSAAAGFKRGDAVALLVERAGRWSYVAFDMP
jgi:serine protease Do